jgi:hypothetical protein
LLKSIIADASILWFPRSTASNWCARVQFDHASTDQPSVAYSVRRPAATWCSARPEGHMSLTCVVIASADGGELEPSPLPCPIGGLWLSSLQ